MAETIKAADLSPDRVYRYTLWRSWGTGRGRALVVIGLNPSTADEETVVAAWGCHGGHRGRGAEVAARIPGLLCFGTTKDGHPKHPLYLRADTPLVPFASLGTPTTTEVSHG